MFIIIVSKAKLQKYAPLTNNWQFVSKANLNISQQ